VFGEQVATGDGAIWFWRVRRDLEALGYAVGAADLCSSSLGFAPRQRLFFVAHTDSQSERARSVYAEMASLPPLGWLPPSVTNDLYGVVQESDGFPGAMGQRRAYGNAINPLVAAYFIRAAAGALA
jgi:hypothetical protein